MNVSQTGLDLIKQFEGLRTEAYLCPAGVWTIGYGHTARVKEGDTCTAAQAEAWLITDVVDAENAVKSLVKVELNQHQFDALVSFTFNLGRGNLASSTLLTRLNAGSFTAAADQFGRWVFAKNVLQPGLVKRRAAEKALFLLH
ncbi:lysozyme [Pantoea sp. Bo_2]|uniref:Lysozyme n=1 Tax=Candidatus Pantoea gossypiicola TaxID=2608008 RepID=A0AB34CKQ9_9GAMM|nr:MULTISPECIES: lysozyme [Pantoea]KAA5937595.1 lysozyme [Pantoea sp. VH_3]KAA5946726.1 lysozyme [Pantoea sp. VH_25]KAA5949546.1 lysozyme [Pantoea sp. VH_24]KAA5957707.1 lysozyme [Pantoea sp. VH_16]KAA5959160.1 lysozyme [Pantoea sp. VH_18]